ncbi:MAG: hypothetical protein F6K04_17100 [Leptolyngbya sp. SIO4C5]|nr:hypothetical protein [Leptolyngbya sp. SIO4C5]
MSAASYYWQLVQLQSSGSCRIVKQTAAKDWLYAQFPHLPEATVISDRPLQKALWQIWQQGEAAADSALLCLRCFVSQIIRKACLQLVRQFGEAHGFTAEDLYPLVLDDTGGSLGDYQPLSMEILKTYDPAKAGLATWTTRLVKHHPALDRLLHEHNLYRVSDWAILNDTSPEQIQRVLSEFHQRTAAEIQQAARLLERYHAVYRRDRQRQLRTCRGQSCLPPTLDQLARMDATISPDTVLSRLQEIALLLRQYRTYVRNRYFPTESLDADAIAEPQALETSESEQLQADFLTRYQQASATCLEQAIAQAIETEVARLQCKKPPRDQVFLVALRLFVCQGISMGAIAPQIGYKNQVQVTRLIQMKAFRTNVRHYWLTQLRQQTLTLAETHLEPDRLCALDRVLEKLLAEEIDAAIEQSQAEAQNPQRSVPTNRFDQQVCHYLDCSL